MIRTPPVRVLTGGREEVVLFELGDMAMGLPQLKETALFTVGEYLEFERKAEERHEFLDGRILAMAGESDNHGDISMSVAGLLFGQLRGKPCRARTKDTKVRSGPTLRAGKTRAGLFSYPDVVVICDELEHLDDHKDVIMNPTAIVEVLSESTESFDRGEKFTRYQTWNPTLQDYLLVSQDRPQVEHFSKQADGSWSYRMYVGLEAAVAIRSIECTLRLADVYDRVTFESSMSVSPLS